MSDSEPKKSNSTLVLAGALVLGAVVGAAVASRGDDELRALERRIDAMETAAADAAAEVGGDLSARMDAMEEARDELVYDLKQLTGNILMSKEEAVEETGEAVAAIENRVQVLAQQMAGIVGRVMELEAGASAPAATAPADSAAPADGAAPAETAPADTAAAPAAEPEEESGAAALEAQLGEDGAAISVGQTARFGEQTFFLSRIDAEAGSARLLAMGQGPVMLGGDAGPVTLDNGCQLTLIGFDGNTAYLKPTCE